MSQRKIATISRTIANWGACGIATLTASAVAGTAPIAFAPDNLIATPGGDVDIVLADIDADNDRDIITLEAIFDFANGQVTGTANVLENNGSGNFALRQSVDLGISPSLENAFHNIDAGDFNQDGFDDFAFVGSTTPLMIVMNDGAGNFNAPIDTGIFVQAGQIIGLIGVADFTGDSRDDVAVGLPGILAVNDGNGGFVAQPFAPISSSSPNLLPADLNNDGNIDIAFNNRIQINDGTGSFTNTSGFPGNFVGECAIGDFNNDNAPDIVCPRVTQTVEEYRFSLNDGTGVMTQLPSLPAFGAPLILRTGNLDGDGNTDIIATHSVICGKECDPTDFVTILRGNGDATFDVIDEFPVVSGTSIAVGDLNNDGLDDLVLGTAFGFFPSEPSSINIVINQTNALLLGDLNCDGLISVADIGPFVLLLTDPVGYAVQFPACDPNRGDINGDGVVSVGDIGGFVALLTGG